MKPFINKQWEARELRFGQNAIIVRRFEIIESVKAINATSVDIYCWDFDKREIGVLGIHNNGNFVHGHVREGECNLLMYGYGTFPDRKLEFRNTYEFAEDGKFIDSYYRFEDGKWKPGHSWVFYVKKE